MSGLWFRLYVLGAASLHGVIFWLKAAGGRDAADVVIPVYIVLVFGDSLIGGVGKMRLLFVIPVCQQKPSDPSAPKAVYSPHRAFTPKESDQRSLQQKASKRGV